MTTGFIPIIEFIENVMDIKISEIDDFTVYLRNSFDSPNGNDSWLIDIYQKNGKASGIKLPFDTTPKEVMDYVFPLLKLVDAYKDTSYEEFLSSIYLSLYKWEIKNDKTMVSSQEIVE